MKLRPELMPPPLEKALVTRLAHLANCLDGAKAGQGKEELEEFNRLGGTSISREHFQGIYKAEEHEDWVRRVLYQRFLFPDPNLTRAEMAEIVSRVMACDDDHDFFLELFLVNCTHPSSSDLIFWPNLVPELPQDRDPTAEEIAALAMRGN